MRTSHLARLRRDVFRLFAIVLTLGCVLGTDLLAQDHLRIRWARLPAAVNAAPVVTIQTPSADGTFLTTATSVQLTGTASDDTGVGLVTWACATCSPTSGTAIGTESWNTGLVIGDLVIGNDTFTAATSQVLTMYSALWTTLIDTATTRPLYLYAGEDMVGAYTSDDSDFTIALYAPDPAIAGPDYTVSVDVTNLEPMGDDDPMGIIFGASNSTNYCGAIWYGNTAVTDLVIFKREANVVAILASATNVDVLLGQTMSVIVDGTSITVQRNGATVSSTTSTFCDNALGVGLVVGAVTDVPGEDMIGTMRFDNFSVSDNDESSGIGLAMGANTIIVTATDIDAMPLMATAQIVVTRSASDTEAPAVSITSPTAAPTYGPTSTGTFSPSGTVTDNVLPVSLSCGCPECTPTSRAGTIVGTDWSLAASFALASGSNVVTCTALDAAANPGADVVTVTYSPADSTPPVTTITTNGGNGAGVSYTTAVTPQTIAGTCTDNVLPTLVTWINSLGGSGTAAGTESWSMSVPLHVGANLITVTCRDEANNTHADTITVTLTSATLTITTLSMPQSVEDVTYPNGGSGVLLGVTGGTGPYTWDNNSGGTTLGGGACTGLSISTAGLVSGTPTTVGTCNFTAKVTDSIPNTDTQALSIGIVATGSETGNTYFATTLIGTGLTFGQLTMRSASQLTFKDLGGHVNFDSWKDPDNTISYDATQDAAKIRILGIVDAKNCCALTLAQDIDNQPTSNVFTVTNTSQEITGGETIIKIDSEMMQNVSRSGDVQTVTRATNGSSIASHTIGTPVYMINNSLHSQMYYPVPGQTLGTTDGHTYLFTWDVKWSGSGSTSYIASGLNNHKLFTLVSGAVSGKWAEITANYSNNVLSAGCYVAGTTVASIGLRSYNGVYAGAVDWASSGGDRRGPGTGTDPQQLPRIADFCAFYDRWTRFWIRVEQRANDYDYFTLWAADELQNKVKIIDNLPLSLRQTGFPNMIRTWWAEFGTSEQFRMRLDDHNMDAWARNLWIGEATGLAADGPFSDVNMEALFVKPIP